MTTSNPRDLVSGRCMSIDEKSSIETSPTQAASSDRPSSSITTKASSVGSYKPKPQLSTLQLLVIHIGAALTLFLATTDATIVSTSLPTISSELKASQNQYTWVGVSYMLTQTAFQPLYGRISDLVGRKTVLYCSIFVFALGSALCGAAQSINWLITARALAGIGGGGIVSAVWVITTEIVEVRQRAAWSQALSITWSCSAIAGPLIGGLFSGTHGTTVSWRWAFYMNLPLCFVALVVLVTSLRHVEFKTASNASWLMLSRKFDFVGLASFMGGTSCIIIGFSFSTDLGWASPFTLTLLVLGTVVLICGALYEKHTSRDPLFPATTFKDMTAVAVLVIIFLHNFAFTAGTFYLALFFQAANGSTPLQSGIKLLPYSLGSSLASMPAAWFIGYWQKRTHDTSGQNRTISLGLFISAVGFGLLNLLNEHASIIPQMIYPLIAGIGIGMLFHAPYQVFARTLKDEELATGTSAFFLVRFTGATVGLSIAGTIFYAKSTGRLPPDLGVNNASAIDYSTIKLLPPAVKAEVLHIVSGSIRLIWTVCAPCLAVAFLISLGLQKLPNSDVAQVSETHTTPTQSSAEDEKV